LLERFETASKRTRLVRRRKLTPYSGRGAIYSWLRVHHEQIKNLRIGEERPWAGLLADLQEDLAAAGLAGKVSLNKVCNIWQRVCRDLDQQPKRSGRLMPSRLSKDWRPAVVVPPPPVFSPSVPAAMAQPQYPSRVMLDRSEEAPMTPEGQAELDRAMAMLKEYDAARFRFGGG
jgi:hypothetical protein